MAMRNERRPNAAARRVPKPLNDADLRALAVRYVARYATSSGKLTAYLNRKLRERGWSGEDAPDIAALVADCVARGFIDDRLFAETRLTGLRARGYGDRRVAQALHHAGVDAEVRAEVQEAEDEDAAWQALLRLARRRRFGPFAASPPDADTARRQTAAMVRAGHSFSMIQRLLSGKIPSEYDVINCD